MDKPFEPDANGVYPEPELAPETDPFYVHPTIEEMLAEGVLEPDLDHPPLTPEEIAQSHPLDEAPQPPPAGG